MAICDTVDNIPDSECIGDSLIRINNNFSNLAANDCSLLTLVNALSGLVTYKTTAAAIGSTECKFGYFGAATKARGDTYFLSNVGQNSVSVNNLADFKHVNEQGTVEFVRMEDVTPLTYTPWKNFFPYKPIGKIISTRIDARVNNMDSTGSNDDLNYTLYVNWTNNKAIITGNYILASLNGGTGNQTFIKQWDFTTGADAIIRTDYSPTTESRFNQLGERNFVGSYSVYTGDCEYVVGVTPSGITKLPTFKYNGSVDPTINETANISLFIENTFKYI